MLKLLKLIAFILSSYCSAQSVCSYTPEQVATLNCLFGFTNDQSNVNGQKIIHNIISDIGLPDANFVVKPCNNISNALAIIYNNKRYILFDEGFINRISYGNNKEYTYLFVLAHEIGHHFNGHTLSQSLTNAEQRQKELECDRFAGYILQKNGASTQDIKNALLPLGNPVNGGTHPQLADRIANAIYGYNDGISQTNDIIKKYNSRIIEDYENYKYSKNLTEARIEMFNYEVNGNKEHLKNAIKKYLIADNTKSDPIVVEELASAFRAEGDYRNTQIYYESAYHITQNPYYILASWELCKMENYGNCADYEGQASKINHTELDDFNTLKILARFYDSKYLDSEVEENNKTSIEILNKILKNHLYEVKSDKKLTSLNLINTLNDLSVSHNRTGNVKEAYSLINEAYGKYDEYFLKNNYYDKETQKIDKNNFIQLLLNKAMYEMRLEKWMSCQKTLSELDSFQLSDNETANYHYYKGRSLLGMGENAKSILEFTNALKVTPSNMTIYYFRGIANSNLPDKKFDAWSDINISCNGGFEPACNIIKKIKK